MPADSQKSGNAAGRDKIKVAIRIRPFNQNEKSSGCKNIIEMKGNQTIIHDDSELKKPPKAFTFDECFWSLDSKDSNFASQEIVFEKLGLGVLENAFQGYNACILAYGQTGSGKSYTMMGTQTDPGIIPRLCNEMFTEIKKRTMSDIRYQVEVTYCEIYNEKVTDLLSVQSLKSIINPDISNRSTTKGNNSKDFLKIREDATYGPYVEGATREIVKDSRDIQKLMDIGNKSRSMASTCFNKESSRSHAVFEITLTEQHVDKDGKPISQMGEKRSKISLVDLAGSEKVSQTGTTRETFKEGVNINKSLLTLMTVVKLLAQNQAKKSKEVHIPYRDSKLTYLLKENIGGNSKTVIVATISPSSYSYSETLSTLNYANTAKSIETRAVVNEDKTQEQIELMQKELEVQKVEIMKLVQAGKDAEKLKEEFEEQTRIYEERAKSWEEKYQESIRQAQERDAALLKMGISLEASGIKVDRKRVYIVNISVDPSLNEMLVYYLNEYNRVGTGDDQTIQIRGLGMKKEHCIIEVNDDGVVFIEPIDNAKICVTGKWINERTELKHSERIMLGVSNIYKINIPKKKINDMTDSDNPNENTMEEEYETAQEEIMKSQLKDDPIQMALENLESLYTSEKNQALEEQKKEYEKQMALINEKYEEALARMSTSQDGAPISNMMHQYGSMANIPPALQSSFATIPQLKDGAWNNVPNWMNSQQNLLDSHTIMSHIQTQFKQWYNQKEKNFSLLLIRLKEQLLKANRLTIEANYLANELAKGTTYKVTLQIPASSLNPNGNKHGIISEPAILVSRDDKPNQIWSLDKLDSKVIQMRDVFEELKDAGCPNRKQFDNPFNDPEPGSSGDDGIKEDPFFDAEEEHRLIGVANVYLRCLFLRIKFKYEVPIINQQGEVSGKLTAELSVVNGELPDLSMRDSNPAPGSMTSSVYSAHSSNMATSFQEDSSYSRSTSGYSLGTPITIRVRVLYATGLPESLSKFVYCQYRFFGQSEPTIVAPVLQPDFVHRYPDQNTSSFKFNNTKDFSLTLSDDLIEHLAEEAVSIEVLGNYSPITNQSSNILHSNTSGRRKSSCNTHMSISSNYSNQTNNYKPNPDLSPHDIISNPRNIRKFAERWMELYRRLEFWVCIEELNEEGVYEKVELLQSPDVESGGIFQLHHGHSRKLRVYIRPNKITKGSRGKLPLVGQHIEEVSIGDIVVMRKSPGAPSNLDSYQEHDLNRLREAWGRAEMKRKEYLKNEINKLQGTEEFDENNGQLKDSPEKERMETLMQQLLKLTYESQAVIVPPEGSGIPGAPATWNPTPGMERHCPVIFFDLNVANPLESPEEPTTPSDMEESLTNTNVDSTIQCSVDHAGNVTTMYGSNCHLTPPSPTQSITYQDTQQIYLPLPICKRYSDCWGVLCSWDSSQHDNYYLDRITHSDQLIYLTCRVVLKLQTPPGIDLVLRKRICVNIAKKDAPISSFFRRLKFLSNQDTNNSSNKTKRYIWNGITYQVVSGIPQSSQDYEDRATMAQLAAASIGAEDNQYNALANGDEPNNNTNLGSSGAVITTSTISSGSGGSSSLGISSEKSSYIEKYIRTVSAVESLMEFDRIRQEAVAQEIASMTQKKKVIPTNPVINPYNQQQINDSRSRYPIQHPFYPANPAAVMGSPSLIKHISVPDFKVMFRSSSLMNLNDRFDSTNCNYTTVDGNNIDSSKNIERMDFDQQTPKSDSIPNLTDLSNTTTANNTPNKTMPSPLSIDKPSDDNNNINDQNKIPIKQALIPRRPQPPKNLMMLSKNQMFSSTNPPQTQPQPSLPSQQSSKKYIKNTSTRTQQQHQQQYLTHNYKSTVNNENDISSTTKSIGYNSSNVTNENNNNNNTIDDES